MCLFFTISVEGNLENEGSIIGFDEVLTEKWPAKKNPDWYIKMGLYKVTKDFS